MLNEGQFAGTGGWVLKPPNYRLLQEHGSSPLKTEAGHSTSTEVDLAIEILAAQDLPGLQDASKQEDLCPYVTSGRLEIVKRS